MTSQFEQRVVRAASQVCRSRNLRDSPALVAAVVQRGESNTPWRDTLLSDFASANGIAMASAIQIAEDVEGAARHRTPKSSKVQVVVVTALALEAAAVESYLHGLREQVHAETGTIYRVGTLRENGTETIVAVVVAMEGNPSAAAETERAISFFKPQVALFVGVAGGLKDDVQKGDVVVASDVYDYSSAKESSGVIRSRVKTLRASYRATQRALALASSGEWSRLAATGAPPLRADDSPRVLVKPIAAGPKLVADSDGPTAQWIKQYCGDAVAVEMEGFGFHTAAHAYPATQAIVVRGISDCVDDKAPDGDEQWQPIAASRAAAFGLALAARVVSQT